MGFEDRYLDADSAQIVATAVGRSASSIQAEHPTRAALVHDEVTARRSREHNHCNVLCLGTDLLSEAQITKIVEMNVGSILVTEGDKVVGIMTERDYLRKIAVQGRTSRDTRVGEIMCGSAVDRR